MLSKKRIVSVFGDIVVSTSETPYVNVRKKTPANTSIAACVRRAPRDTAVQKMKSCLTVSTTRHSSRRLTSQRWRKCVWLHTAALRGSVGRKSSHPALRVVPCSTKAPACAEWPTLRFQGVALVPPGFSHSSRLKLDEFS